MKLNQTNGAMMNLQTIKKHFDAIAAKQGAVRLFVVHENENEKRPPEAKERDIVIEVPCDCTDLDKHRQSEVYVNFEAEPGELAVMEVIHDEA